MKKMLIVVSIAIIAVLVIVILILKGVIELPALATMEGELETETEKVVTSSEDLKEGSFYVWHNENSNNIEKDLAGVTKPDVFKECPAGVKNWEKSEFTTHTLWFSTAEDADIPTLYPGDELIYVNSTKVPYEGIQWEHFADYGYSIGVANLIGDDSGHYHIPYDPDKGYAGYINPESDVAVLNDYITVSELFLDRIGSVEVRDDLVTDGGTVYGLDRNMKYLCEWYTGTNYQDYYMTANTHVFSSIETFTTYDYKFHHSNCISITIPEWLKTGCYYLEDIGFFRYVTGDDVKKYSGAAFDPDIDWNDPIIIRDQDGFLVYDPTQKDGEAFQKSTESPEIVEERNENPPVYQGEGDGYDPDGENDVGVEGWEDLSQTNEIIVNGYDEGSEQENSDAQVEQEIEEPYYDN